MRINRRKYLGRNLINVQLMVAMLSNQVKKKLESKLTGRSILKNQLRRRGLIRQKLGGEALFKRNVLISLMMMIMMMTVMIFR